MPAQLQGTVGSAPSIFLESQYIGGFWPPEFIKYNSNAPPPTFVVYVGPVPSF